MRSCLAVTILLLAIAGCMAPAPTHTAAVASAEFLEGDIVFQHIDEPMGELIVGVTRSPYSHCGIVTWRDGRPWVLEAAGPVRLTPLERWIARGHRGWFTQVRPRKLDPGQIAAAVTTGMAFMHLPYDMQYELDDEKVYCSELVHKAFARGAGVPIGEPLPLGQMNWRPYETQIRELAEGELPLERQIVSPGSVAESPHVRLIHSTFPDSGAP